MITYLKGDATSPQAKGNKIIAHVVNSIGKWGKGFVMAVSKRWPHTRDDYLEWYRTKNFGLGEVQVLQVESHIWVANMVGQQGIRTGSNGPPIRYDALANCLEAVNHLAIKLADPVSVHMPRIGCGLAGGKWENVEPLLDVIQCPIFVYDY